MLPKKHLLRWWISISELQVGLPLDQAARNSGTLERTIRTRGGGDGRENLSEGRVRDVVDRCLEVRVIEDVEEVGEAGAPPGVAMLGREDPFSRSEKIAADRRMSSARSQDM